VRIVSLLPSATETLFALGLGEQVVAVSHECDFPPEAASRPIVTHSTLSLAEQNSGGIEAAVSQAATEGWSLYDVDVAAIRDLKPDLVVAQDVCRVCAVDADQIAPGLEGVPMLRQHPHTLGEVLDDIQELAVACATDAGPLLASLRERLEQAAEKARALPSVRGVFLEWLDPPYPAGHWTSDLLALAGIEDPLARPGLPSVAGTWAQVAATRPALLVLAPCGFNQERTLAEAALVQTQIDAVGATQVVALDGSAYFNRPGPRLVDSLEVLVEAR